MSPDPILRKTTLTLDIKNQLSAFSQISSFQLKNSRLPDSASGPPSSNPNSERVTLSKFLSHFVGWWNTCLPELCLYPESLCIHIHFYISHVDKLRLMLAPITNGSVDSLSLKWKIFIEKQLQIQQKAKTQAQTQIAGTQWHERWGIFHA